MSAFDATLNVISMTASAPSEEALKEGSPPLIEVSLTLGAYLPFMPPGSDSPIPLPLGQIRYSFDKEAAEKLVKSVGEAASTLPSKTKIDIANASDLIQVEEVAAKLGSLRERADGRG